MPDTRSIVIVKSFEYRGVEEEFSNRYHFEGGVFGDTPPWKTLADAIIAGERPSVPPPVSFVRAYGYEAGIDHSVVVVDYTQPPATVLNGTFAGVPGQYMPGDVAAMVRWPTFALNSKGKMIYCRKYMHGVYSDAADADKFNPAQSTALLAFATLMTNGNLPQGVKYCGPQGADLGPPLVSQWLTTRTLKRRGKRPSSG